MTSDCSPGASATWVMVRPRHDAMHASGSPSGETKGVVARHGNEQRGFGGRQHQTVRARAIDEQAIEPAIRAQAIHTAGRVMQAGLALVGEIHIAVAGDDQIVGAFVLSGEITFSYTEH